MTDPVIIIGMHRSGTSSLARALGQFGLFQGVFQDGNHEPLYFQWLNISLMASLDASWQAPDRCASLIDDRTSTQRLSLGIHQSLGGLGVAGYLGPSLYLRYRSLLKLDFPWGWKDPRTTFTLPVWLNIFPDARVIHVVRHGVDVAASLANRTHAITTDPRARFDWRKIARRVAFRPIRRSYETRIGSLPGAFDLWGRYVDQGRRCEKLLPPDRFLEITYENYLRAPRSTLKRAAEFSELTPPEKTLDAVALEVRRDRAFAYRREEHLQAFADTVIPELERRGYHR